jgi:hypothetical protein
MQLVHHDREQHAYQVKPSSILLSTTRVGNTSYPMSWMTGWVGKAVRGLWSTPAVSPVVQTCTLTVRSSGVAPYPVRIRGRWKIRWAFRLVRVTEWPIGGRWSRGVGRLGWVGVGAAFFGSLLRARVGLVGTVARGSGWVGESVWVRARASLPAPSVGSARVVPIVRARVRASWPGIGSRVAGRLGIAAQFDANTTPTRGNGRDTWSDGAGRSSRSTS